jgi:hypothetical protein
MEEEMNKKKMTKCEQVVQVEPQILCGRPGRYHPGLYRILCDEHEEYIRKLLDPFGGLPGPPPKIKGR